MDLVPHIPHLNGLEIQFMKMHIDREPLTDRTVAYDGHMVNGAGHARTIADGPADNGFTNGYGPPSSTYF